MFSFQKFSAASLLLSALSFLANGQSVHGHFNVKWTPSKIPASASGAAILQSLKPHPQPPPHPIKVATPMDCNILTAYGALISGTYTNIFPLPPTCFVPNLSGLNGIPGDVVSGIGTDDMNAFWTFYWSNDAVTTVDGTLEFAQGCQDDTSIVQYWTFTGYDATGDPAYYIASKVWDRFGGLVLEGSVTYTADKPPVFVQNPPQGIVETCGSPSGGEDPGDGGDGGDAKPIKPMLAAPPALIPHS